MHRLKLKESPDCDCGTGIQTEEHILMSCPTHAAHREIMFDNIERMFQRENTPFNARSITFNSALHPQGKTALKLQMTKEVRMYLQRTDVNL